MGCGVTRRQAGAVVLLVSVALVLSGALVTTSSAAGVQAANDTTPGALTDLVETNQTVDVPAEDVSWLNESGALALPLPAEYVGEAESGMDATVGGSDTNETVNGTVLGAYGPVTVERSAYEDLGIDPAFRTTGEGFELWYPGLDEGTNYDIVVESAEGLFSDTIRSHRDGGLLVDHLAGTDSANLTVTRAGDDIELINHSVEHTTSELEMSVTNETLEFGAGVDGLSVYGVLSDESFQPLEGQTVEDGAVSLETAIATDEYALITGAGVLTGPALDDNGDTEAEPDEDDSGILAGIVSALSTVFDAAVLIVVPAAVGVFLGYGMGSIDRGGERGHLVVGVNAATGAGAAVLVVGVLSGQGAIPTGGSLVPAVVGLALGVVAGPAVYHRQLEPGQSPTTTTPETFTATCSIKNQSATATLHYWPAGGNDSDRRTERVRGGTATLQLPAGSWHLQVSADGKTSPVKTVNSTDPRATLTVPQECTLTVVDVDTGEPIPGATVARIGGSGSTTSGSDGTVVIRPPSDGGTVQLEVGHDEYGTQTTTIDFTAREHRIALSPETGSIQIDATIDGRPAGNQSLRVAPADRQSDERDRTVALAADGTATVDGVGVGTYELTLEGAQSDRFEGGTTTVTVRRNQTVTAAVEARFSWSLSSTQRETLSSLRSDVQSLARQSGRDTAIPRYYGSTVEALLDVVETLPRSGSAFLGQSSEPGPAVVADSLLEAAQSSLEAIHEAMSTKRIVDLFAACSDLPDHQVRWSGRCDLASALERLESTPGDERHRLKPKYEAVKETVEDNREDLAEVGPAMEMLDAAWTMVNDSEDTPAGLARIYAAELLLEAVEQLFDHDPLRQRLERTVF